MSGADGEHLGFDFGHVFSGQRGAFVGVEARCNAAPTCKGPGDFAPDPLWRAHHPRMCEEEAVLRWR